MTGKRIVVLLATVFAIAGQSFSEASRPGAHAQATAEPDILASVLSIPSATPRGPQELLQDYEADMKSITQQFSERLAAIAAAVNRGELTREQGESISSEQYQLAQMQFDLLSALRELLQQDLARAASARSISFLAQRNKRSWMRFNASSWAAKTFERESVGGGDREFYKDHAP